eukprot:8616057-Pyramimonas_sp.AAC.1
MLIPFNGFIPDIVCAITLQVGVDPFVLSYDLAKAWREKFVTKGIELASFAEVNFVDSVWGDERPALPCTHAFHHPLEYSGLKLKEKVEMCFRELQSVDAEVFVCSALDEVAWLLNVRGADIPFNPVLISYVVVHKTSGLIQWYIDADKVQPALKDQLSEEAAPYKVALRPHFSMPRTDTCQQQLGAARGGARSAEGGCQVACELAEGAPRTRDAFSSRKCAAIVCRFYAFAFVSSTCRPLRFSSRKTLKLPDCHVQAIKNKAELEGMRSAHLKDAVALIQYL